YFPEIPAEHIDPAAIDLTPLVNTLINSSHSGSRQLFSLLSVTSYSSLALHKLTLLVYNISSVRSIESSVFRRRFCYCVTNETNDLTDFTAILLDVMGNSTSYLHELFKSSSILSVSQRNNSDCIYICVMAGKMGMYRKLSLFLFLGLSASPAAVDEAAASTAKITTAQPLTAAPQPTTVMPQSYATAETLETTQQPMAPSTTARAVTTQRGTTPTVAASQSGTTEEKTTLASITTLKQRTTTTAAPTAAAPTTAAPRLPTAPGRASTFSPAVSLIRTPASTSTAPPHMTSTVHPTRLSPVRASAGPTVPRRTTGPLVRGTTTPSKPTETEKPGKRFSVPGVTTTVGAHKLQPCVLELCKFFSQCLCRPFSHKTRMKRSANSPCCLTTAPLQTAV
uniref:HHLA1 neighbor of OC90 n=1 Tax=Oreochromis niloticus TaxID=8128 RepID=A0A669EKS7_ORENI